MSKVIGATVGTTIRTSQIEKKMQPIKTVNGKKPDANGNVEVNVDVSSTVESKVTEHNVAETSHNDIRLLISELAARLNAVANSTDEDLDQLAELVAYIKSNKSLIDGITTSKVSVEDIIDNLTTNTANKPLSAKQGVELKALVDALDTNLAKFEEADEFHYQAIVAYGTSISDHEERISEQSANITNLTTRVGTLENNSSSSSGTGARIVISSTTSLMQFEPNTDYVYRYAMKYIRFEKFLTRSSVAAERWTITFKVGPDATIIFLPEIVWIGGEPPFTVDKVYWMHFVAIGVNSPIYLGFWQEVTAEKYST